MFQQVRETTTTLTLSGFTVIVHSQKCPALVGSLIFKAGSRNEYNQKRKAPLFQRNFKRLFGFPMPHGDSVHNVIALLDEAQVEQLNQKMVQVLLKRKVFHKSRYRHHWYRIAVDVQCFQIRLMTLNLCSGVQT